MSPNQHELPMVFKELAEIWSVNIDGYRVDPHAKDNMAGLGRIIVTKFGKKKWEKKVIFRS